MSEEISVNKNDKQTSFTKRWKVGKMNYCTTVDKVDGGFIITEEKYGNEEGEEGKEGEYISESKKKVTTENPFAQEEDKGLFSFVNKIFVD